MKKATEALKKVKEANRSRRIPSLDAEALLPRMCGVHMGLAVDVEEKSRGLVSDIKRLGISCEPATAAAVAILWHLSGTAPGQGGSWLAKASEASGKSEKTLSKTLDDVKNKAQRAADAAAAVAAAAAAAVEEGASRYEGGWSANPIAAVAIFD